MIVVVSDDEVQKQEPGRVIRLIGRIERRIWE